MKNRMTQRHDIGVLIRTAQEDGSDPVARILASLGGWQILQCTLVNIDDEDRIGHDLGTKTIKGTVDPTTGGKPGSGSRTSTMCAG